MNARKELSALFDRTIPEERAVLVRMARARERRMKTKSQSSWAASRLFGRVLLGGAGVALAMGAALFLARTPTPHTITAEPPVPVSPRRSVSDEILSAEPAAVALSEPPVMDRKDAASPTQQNQPERVQRSLEQPKAVSALPEAKPSASWSQVAEALRNGQNATAERLVAELAQSRDPEARDNARLFQLRSLVTRASAQGTAHSETTRARLSALVVEGSTSSIRESARKLLRELERSPSEK